MEAVLKALRETVRAREAYWKTCDQLDMAIEAECGLEEATDMNEIDDHIGSLAATCDDPDTLDASHAQALIDQCRELTSQGF